LEFFIDHDPILQKDVIVRRGEIVPTDTDGFSRRSEQLALSQRRVQLADSFCNRLVTLCPWIRLVAISGSTAYGGTRPLDDIDFFMVTRRNRLWVTLMIAMLAARHGRMKNRDWPVLCFNRILEEDQCFDAFREARDPLFAREALSLRILDGPRFYHELLHSAVWMERIFPELFRRAIGAQAKSPRVTNSGKGAIWSVANLMARWILAPYLTIVGLSRNKRLERSGNPTARFRTIIEPGFFAYESRKYDLLRSAYEEAFEWP
jgi:hypothetical protein